MKDLTIIIPVKEYDESIDNMLAEAIKSCKDNKIILVGKNVTKFEEKNSLKNLSVIENENSDCTYQENVGKALESVNTEYFSVLEYDDRFSDIWIDAFEEYLGFENEEIFGYLPLTEIIDFVEKRSIGYANEAFWASSFSERIGFLDIESMTEYLSFNTSGAIFKTKDFIDLGGLKKSMKLVFWYEFLLRSLYNGKKIFVVPKVGYFHVVNRDGSLSSEYGKTISEEEADWWVDLAKKEYFFKNDRNKKYGE